MLTFQHFHQASRAGAEVTKSDGSFIYPTYVQLTIGNVFSLGFGPFRWVCTSGKEEDLRKTDEIAAEVIGEQLTENPTIDQEGNLRDNLTWVRGRVGYHLSLRLLQINKIGD